MLSRLVRPPSLVQTVTRSGAGIASRRSMNASVVLRQKALDYYDEIMVDHNNFRDLHSRFVAAYNRRDESEMTKISNTLVREAALHSDGEELSVYRTLDQKGLHGCAEKDREDHQIVKQALKHVDSNSIASLGIEEYANAVERACQLLFKHAEEEERDHYKKLSAALTPDEKASLAKDFLKARKQAPSRPHPSAPQHGSASQKLAGGMTKPMDAAVNAMRDHVQLKHAHADA